MKFNPETTLNLNNLFCIDDFEFFLDCLVEKIPQSKRVAKYYWYRRCCYIASQGWKVLPRFLKSKFRYLSPKIAILCGLCFFKRSKF